MQKIKSIPLFGKQWEVKLPTVGQIMDIESRKIMLTNGTYAEMLKTDTASSAFNLDLVDAISHFVVLMPGLSKSLDVDTVYDLDALRAREIVEAYKKHFHPWYQPFLKELYDDMELEEKGQESIEKEG